VSALVDRVILAAYRAGWMLVRRLPERIAHALFDLIADVAWRRGGKGLQRMRANYARVRPELDADSLDALVRAGMRSYLRYWCEAFRLPDLTEADLVRRVRTVNDAPVRHHLASGQPAVMFLGHMGNWDLAGAWSTTQLAPVTTVAERLRPEELYDEFLAFRERLGMRILPLTGGSDVFRELTKALRRNAFVALLADRDLTEGGAEVDFCGHRARMAVGPAALAVTTGAALHPVSVHYERAATGRGYDVVVTFHERVTVPEAGTTREKVIAMTQACADVLSRAVREHTEDWHMMQRVFADDLAPVAGAGRSGAVPAGDPASTGEAAR
jgi:lauroyl/myristoyl acyltransferase